MTRFIVIVVSFFVLGLMFRFNYHEGVCYWLVEWSEIA